MIVKQKVFNAARRAASAISVMGVPVPRAGAVDVLIG
jgi:hypothetical protein